MSRTCFAWRACASAALLALAACSNSAGGVNDNGQDGGTESGGAPLDEAVRFATIDAGQAVYLANLGKTKPERDAALVTFFRSQTTVEAAGISAADNVWVRFTDGTSYYVFDNAGPPPATPLREPPPAPPAAGPEAEPRPPLLNDLPQNPSAIAAISLEPGWKDVTGEIGTWLTDGGYSVRTGGMRVSDFESMSNVGVLFWQTHSGVSELRPDAGPLQPDGGPPVDFAFMTSTVATEVLGQGIYKPLRDDGSLAVGSVSITENGQVRQEPRYAITQKYIREKLRGKFAPDALVAIDSCTSASADAAWAAAGVSHFAGWSSLSGNLSPIAFERLFDRLLGQNSAPPVSTPKERPFPSKTTEPWMQALGYDLDRSVFSDGPSTAQLLFFSHAGNGDFAILRPTIFRLLNTAPGGTGQRFYRWTLEGTFGDDPGPAGRSVMYGTTPLDVLSWDNGSILVKVPAAPIPSGALQVSVGSRKSEPVKLTEWVIPFTYTLIGEDTLQYVLTANCRLRADVRGFRNAPMDVLSWPPIVTWTLADSNGNLAASGQLHDSTGHLVEQWSGGGPLPWFDPATNPTNFVLCQGNLDHATSTVQAFVVQASAQYSTLSGPAAATIRGIAVPMVLTMDWQTLRINGDTLTANPDQLGSHGVSATLQWPSVLPSNAPADDDGR